MPENDQEKHFKKMGNGKKSHSYDDLRQDI